MSNAINAKDLRIGNYVKSSAYENIHCTVTSLNQYDTIGTDYGDSDHVYFGIPLTEDWLRRFGLEKCDENIYRFSRFTLIWKPGYQYWYVVSFPEDTYLTKIEWVHEWQNFVFVMNGSELTLKD